VGAYQFGDDQTFHRVDSSSFNTVGTFDPQDLNPTKLADQLADGKVWLPPYPGGAAEWNTGFTPYSTMDRFKNDSTGVLSLGGPAFMIVAKFRGRLSHMTWYVLNQRTFLNGADDSHGCVNPTCSPSGNCWGCGYGEVDILEGNYCEPNLCMTLNNGEFHHSSCLYGDTHQKNVFNPDADGEDPLIAAVFDSEGVTVYINPSWDGLTDTQAASQLAARPTSAVKVVKAPAHVRGMWKDLQNTYQLPATDTLINSPNVSKPLQTCAAPGWDVDEDRAYSVTTPVSCCRGQAAVNMSGTLTCPGGAPFSTSR